ncbi:MAG: glycosyltransferase family 2 protein [Bacteroidales bacterium]|nr:glycosyltransferase family 2 protein [Bacteroidales bacterium]
MKVCAIIPTYNNAATLPAVVDDVRSFVSDIIVINDGSTDGTGDFLRTLGDTVTVVSYLKNRGKGYALRQGFKAALQKGFDTAVTLDSDGQHRASDIPILLDCYSADEGSLVVGSRKFDNPNMPSKNGFANRFSNFWFTVQTARRLPDTQTGFRVYPLKKIGRHNPLNNRYEAELEILVRCAWRDVKIKSCPINVYYPPQEERVSHFRPTADFARISVLNTVLCLLAVVYGYPSMGIRKLIKLLKK